MKKNLSKKVLSVVSWNITNPVNSDSIIHKSSAEEILKINADINIIREEFGASEEFMVNLVTDSYIRFSNIKHQNLKNGFLSILIKKDVVNRRKVSTEWNVEKNHPTFLNINLGSMNIIGVRFSEELEKRKEEVKSFTEYLKKFKEKKIVLTGNFENSELKEVKFIRVAVSDDYIKYSSTKNINRQTEALSIVVKKTDLSDFGELTTEVNIDSTLPKFITFTLKSEKEIKHKVEVKFRKIIKKKKEEKLNIKFNESVEKRKEELNNFIEYLKDLRGKVILTGNFDDKDLLKIRNSKQELEIA